MAFTRLDNLFETSWWGNRGKKKMSPEESEYQKKLWDKYKAENEKPFKPKKK
jgi:acid phosphatase class B